MYTCNRRKNHVQVAGKLRNASDMFKELFCSCNAIQQYVVAINIFKREYI